MKKKLVSTLALSLCFVMSAGAFAGCKGDGDSSGGNKPLTEDEIYAKVVEAMEATVSYTGAYTGVSTTKEEGKEVRPDQDEDEVSSSQTTQKVSVDPAAKKLFVVAETTHVGDDDGRVEGVTGKLFKEGDKYYTYTKQKDTYEDPAEQEMYMEVSETMAGVSMDGYSLSEFDYSEYMMPTGSITIADYNAAWASYIADSKAELVAGTADEESDWYGHSGDGSYVVSAAEVDGAYVLTVEMSISMTDEEDYTESVSYKYVFTAKDGKLVSVLEKEEYFDSWYEADDGTGNWVDVAKDAAGAQLASSSESEENLITLSYAFDQAGYDAITTTLPATVQKQPDVIAQYMKVVVNGADYGQKYVYGQTVAEALSDAWSNGGADVVWYKDEACTQAIDPATMTVEQFLALDAVYGKVTAKAGYVLYTRWVEYTTAADVTDAYKIVLATRLNDNDKRVQVCAASDGFWLYNGSSAYYVNGELVDFGGQSSMAYPVEEGKTYDVKEVYEVQKEDCNFFDMYN